MNKQRRMSIREAMDGLNVIKEDLESILDEEQEAYDNLPESIQDSDRGEAMSDGLYNLESAISSLEEATNALEEAIQ